MSESATLSCSPSLFSWLTRSLSVLPPSEHGGLDSRNNLLFTSPTISHLVNGSLFVQILERLLKPNSIKPIYRSNPNDASPQARLYNWNSVLQTLKSASIPSHLRISVSDEQKGLILAGDLDQIHSLLENIYNRSENRNGDNGFHHMNGRDSEPLDSSVVEVDFEGQLSPMGKQQNHQAQQRIQRTGSAKAINEQDHINWDALKSRPLPAPPVRPPSHNGRLEHSSSQPSDLPSLSPFDASESVQHREKLLSFLSQLTADSLGVSQSSASSLLQMAVDVTPLITTSTTPQPYSTAVSHLIYTSNSPIFTHSKASIWLEKFHSKLSKPVQYAVTSNSLFYLLDLLKPALLSTQINVVTQVFRVFHTILTEFPSQSENIWLWFSSPAKSISSSAKEKSPKHIPATLCCLDYFLSASFLHHSSLLTSSSASFISHYFAFFDSLCRLHYFEFFSLYLPVALPGPIPYLSFCRFILPAFLDSSPVSSPSRRSSGKSSSSPSHAWIDFLEDGVLDLLLDYSLQHLKSSNTSNATEIRCFIIKFVVFLWRKCGAEMKLRLSTAQSIVEAIKKLAKQEKLDGADKRREKGAEANMERELLELQTVALGGLFQLMAFLTGSRHSLAPTVYKALILALIDHAKSPSSTSGSESVIASSLSDTHRRKLRQFIVKEFIHLLEENHELPVQVFIEPLVKYHSSHGFSPLDFQFFSCLAVHPRFPVKPALLMLHMLGKTLLALPQFVKAASKPFLAMIDRFHHEQAVVDYVEKYVKVALSIFMKSTEELHGASAKGESGSSGGTGSPLSASVKHQLSIDVVSQIYYLNHREINDRLTPLLVFVYEDCMILYNTVHTRLRSLIPEINPENYSEKAALYSEQQKNLEAAKEAQQQPKAKHKTLPQSLSAGAAPISATPTLPPLPKPGSAHQGSSGASVSSTLPRSGIPVRIPRPRLHTSDSMDSSSASHSKHSSISSLPEKPATASHVPFSPPSPTFSTHSAMTNFTLNSSVHSHADTASIYAPSQIGSPPSPPRSLAARANDQLDAVKRKREEKLRKQAEQEAAERERAARITAQAKRAAKLRMERLQQVSKLQRAQSSDFAPESKLPAMPQHERRQSSASAASSVGSKGGLQVSTSVPASSAATSLASPAAILLLPKKPIRIEKDDPNLDYSYFPSRLESALVIVYSDVLKKLFKIYYGRTPQIARIDSFAALEKHSKMMNLADFIKLLQDLSVVPNLVMKSHVSSMFKILCKEGTGDSAAPVPVEAPGLTFPLFLKAIWCVSRLADLTAIPPMFNKTRYEKENEELRSLWVFLQYLQQAAAVPDALPAVVKLNWPSATAMDLIELEKMQRKNKIRKMCAAIVHDLVKSAVAIGSGVAIDRESKEDNQAESRGLMSAAESFKGLSAPRMGRRASSAPPVPSVSGNALLSALRQGEDLESIEAAKERQKNAALKAKVAAYREMVAKRETALLSAQLEQSKKSEEAAREAARKEKRRREEMAEQLAAYKAAKQKAADEERAAQMAREVAEKEARKKNIEFHQQLKAEKKRIVEEEERKRLALFQAKIAEIEAKSGINQGGREELAGGNPGLTSGLSSPTEARSPTGNGGEIRKERRKWNQNGNPESNVSSPVAASKPADISQPMSAKAAQHNLSVEPDASLLDDSASPHDSEEEAEQPPDSESPENPQPDDDVTAAAAPLSGSATPAALNSTRSRVMRGDDDED